MSKLETLINQLCPNGVEYRNLEDCCITLDNKRKPVTKGARENGKYPYYGANGIQDYVSGYIFDGVFVLVGEDGSVVTENGNPVVNWAEGKIWVNNHAHVIKEKEGVLLRYLYHYLQIINVKNLIHGNIPKLTGKDFKALQIPVPPIEVQNEIVRILDNFTQLQAELEAELEAELDARKKQYEYYRDKLLYFGKNSTGYKNNNIFKPLGEICDFIRGPFGGSLKKECFINQGYAVYEQQNAIYNNLEFRYFIDEKKYNELKKFIVYTNDLIVSCSGTIGKVMIIPENAPKGIINQALLKLTPHKNIYVRYLKYCFENTIEMTLNSCSRGGAIKNVPSVSELKKIEIPVPPLEEQQRIVEILDRFDKLCNDLTSGLPAEIQARQQQYEYYRDKLLNFKELV